MGIHDAGVRNTLDFLADLQLLPGPDCRRMNWLLAPDFPFRAQREVADSLHVHVKVADTGTLPDDAIVNAGGLPQNRQSGYVKYVFPAGVNVIFSSIPVAEEDRLPTARPITIPVLDHVGFDLRKETDSVRRRFDAIAESAARNGWCTVGQGGGARPVLCCHTQVNEKRWVYPPSGLAAWTRPLEFAFGPLVVTEASMGCDLRPIDPSDARAREASACCVGAECAPKSWSGTRDAGCCDSSPVVHSAGSAEQTSGKFRDYSNAATTEAGALTAREKTLIALALAHSRPCASSINSFTNQCIEAGVSPQEMREAADVALAMTANMDLLQGVPLQDASHAKAQAV